MSASLSVFLFYFLFVPNPSGGVCRSHGLQGLWWLGFISLLSLSNEGQPTDSLRWGWLACDSWSKSQMSLILMRHLTNSVLYIHSDWGVPFQNAVVGSVYQCYTSCVGWSWVSQRVCVHWSHQVLRCPMLSTDGLWKLGILLHWVCRCWQRSNLCCLVLPLRLAPS